MKRDLKDAENELKSDLINQVIKHNLFEVPDTLLNFYLDSVVEDLKKKYQKVEEKKIREEYTNIAIGQIRWDIIFHRIAEKETIEVTQEDLDIWVKDNEQILKAQGVEAKKLVEVPANVKKIKEEI